MIERLPLRENHLILGPPGSGKTNVLLRRAQYVRSQGMPNVLVLSFTRPLSEFVKTGCYDERGREIFPRGLVTTIESWTRSLYTEHDTELPETDDMSFSERKAAIASGAVRFANMGKLPRYDIIFIDEAQDLLEDEVELMRSWSPTLFLVGDDRQKIYEEAPGLAAVRRRVPNLREERLRFHYRLVPELCETADRIQVSLEGAQLAATSQYNGPRPGRVDAHGPLNRQQQINAAIERIKSQLRVYGDLIEAGDRIGIIVPRKDDRDFVLQALDGDADLEGLAQIIRARSGDPEDSDYSPAFDPECPIAILTEKGSKGLEFRAAHWLFCSEGKYYRTTEIYYTVVTRAKTALDLYYAGDLPDTLARSFASSTQADW